MKSPRASPTANRIPNPGDRYSLDSNLGSGVYGRVYKATDKEASNKAVAIKIQKLTSDTSRYVEKEYEILKNLTTHPNLPDFYGIFKRNSEIWFVMELCEGGSVSNLVNGLLAKNRRMAEEHIAYIIKESVKALVFLHENHIMHRDVKASNVLLTKNGEVKLVDFGISRVLKDDLDKTGTCLGSPCWMAPEIITGRSTEEPYDFRTDVWALGITAIEIGDGRPPYYGMHPTRVLFQIVTNPPPTVAKPFTWSENFLDFINECLTKNPEHRPYIMEVIEHPFLEQVPENYHHLTLEVKMLINNIDNLHRITPLTEEIVIDKRFKSGIDGDLENMYVEDLASLDVITEETVLNELEARFNLGQYHTFIGDILLVLNPNEEKNIYGKEFHEKYTMKSRSDNSPHIYAIADSAYQNALHHMIPQKIVLAGESGSGKTTSYLHLLDHLLLLGENINISTERLKNAIKLIHFLTSAPTRINSNSTRCILKTDLKYGSTGKITGAIFSVQQLEKWRISAVDLFQGNFHVLYYVYYGLKHSKKLEKYYLDPDCQYRLLYPNSEDRNPNKDECVEKFKTFLKILEDFEFTEEDIGTVLSTFAAILLVGEVNFFESEDAGAVIDDKKFIKKISVLLRVEPKNLMWALINYCLVQKGTVVKKRSTLTEAQDARDVFANTLYARLVDYIVSAMNKKLSFGRAIFGEKYSVQLFDYFGFECMRYNHLPQLYINSLNEEMQYHYLQRVFTWERMDANDEDVECPPFRFFDNKDTLDLLLNKTNGLMTFIDDTSKQGHSGGHIIDLIKEQDSEHVTVCGSSEFSVAHYTGKVKYDVSEMPDKNRDFLPPEVIETMRQSDNSIIKILFTNKLDKTGNLLIPFDTNDSCDVGKKRRYTFTPTNPSEKSQTQYSQIRRMRTSASIFKSLSLSLLKDLSIGSGSGGTHFVRCVRTDLKYSPESFNKELVRQQLRALAVVETARARQKGYPHRVSFSEFLRRYQFLAFDYNENVDINKDNCRLLLIRLKMEGWAIGKSKVFLKYYNEEYLSRLYENQVRKIVKIQSILRGFLVKCRNKQKIKSGEYEKERVAIMARRRLSKHQMSEDEAACVIQKAFKNKKYPEHIKDYKLLDDDACKFIKTYAIKWKRQSIFHVLMQYRAMRLHDLFNFGQQIHFYNLDAFHFLQRINPELDLGYIDYRANVYNWLGEARASVLKVPFRLEDIPYYDTTKMNNHLTNPGYPYNSKNPFTQSELESGMECVSAEPNDTWDMPYRWRYAISDQPPPQGYMKKGNEDLINLPYNRDPSQPLNKLPERSEKEINDYEPRGYYRNNPSPVSGDHSVKSWDRRAKETKNIENAAVSNRMSQNGGYYKHEPNVYNKNYSNNSIVSKPVPAARRNFDDCHINSSAQPANKDFNFIKVSKSSNRPKNEADPVAELRKIAKHNETESEDDPPFNFQAMLRKTNYRRDDMDRRNEERTQIIFPAKKDFNNETSRPVPGKRQIQIAPRAKRKSEDVRTKSIFDNGLTNGDHDEDDDGNEDKIGKQISAQLAPGVFIEGIEVDL